MTRGTTRLSCLRLMAAGLALAPGPAEAVHLEVDAGMFAPWSGDTGWYISGAVLGGAANGKIRLGGEFEYRSFDAKGPNLTLPVFAGGVPFGLDFQPKVGWDTWALHFIFQYHFMPDAIVQPYLGIAIGPTLNRFNEADYNNAFNRVNPAPGVFTLTLQNWGGGLEVIGNAGVTLRFPGAEWLSLYGEAKFSYDAVVSSEGGSGTSVEVLNLGGVNLGGGLRFSF